jgi:hypothetical protein
VAQAIILNSNTEIPEILGMDPILEILAMEPTTTTKIMVTINFFMSYCTIISAVILGQFHENLFTPFFLPGFKKKGTNCSEIFLMKSRNLLPIAIQRYLVLNLLQNKFHKNNLKTEKNHNKFSSHFRENVPNYRTKRT